MLQKIKQTLYGDLSGEELKQFGMLGIILMFILGTYWLMRPLKDGIFLKMVGKDYLAYAKTLSVLIVIPLAMAYAKLIDTVEKQKLFYVICSCYMSFFIFASFMLAHPTIGLTNPVASPKRLFGWALYLAIETFGTLVIHLFWSFVISNTDSKSAKKGFPFIIVLAQVGTITGPYLATQAPKWGLPNLALVVAAAIFIVPLLVKWFITVYPSAAESTNDFKKQKKSGPIEGLKLLLTKNYLLGLLGVATLYEVAGTIIDFQMKFMANATYDSPEKLTQFFGYYGMSLNTMTLLFTLIGTSFIMRRFGITFCLIMFPTLAGVAISATWMFPALGTIFATALTIKGLSYALNNPCKEILYIPTSKDVKFKAKSWIDMFGARTAKMTGGNISQALFSNLGLDKLLAFGPIIALGVVGVWLPIAAFTGRKNQELVDSGQKIE